MRRLAATIAIVACAAGVARAGAVDVDFSPKADFKHYNTWAWIPGNDEGHRGVLADPTMRERVKHAIAVRLKTAGLLPVAEDQKPDLYVRYQGDIGEGKEITTSAGSLLMYNWSDPAAATLQFTAQTAALIVDLVDVKTTTLAWRLYIHDTYNGPNDPPDKLARALDKGFEKYPPSAAEVARKARAMEKASGAK
jgi:Domain of unknown function (DUF4136)